MGVMEKLEQSEVPRTLHALLRQGLDGLAVRERDPRYRVDMSRWHQPDWDGRVCMVCLAPE